MEVALHKLTAELSEIDLDVIRFKSSTEFDRMAQEALAKKKQALDATKAADLELLGSDAESEDGVDQGLQLEAEQVKLNRRKEEKVEQAVSIARKEQAEKLKAIIQLASQLLSTFDAEARDMQIVVSEAGPSYPESESITAIGDSPQLLIEAPSATASSSMIIVEEAVIVHDYTAFKHFLNCPYGGISVISISDLLQVFSSYDEEARRVVLRNLLTKFASLKQTASQHELVIKTLKEEHSTALKAEQAISMNNMKNALKFKQELNDKDALYQVGVTVRVGFHETVKRTWHNGVMKVIRGDPDADIVIAKNHAVHGGNFHADVMLFKLGILKSAAETEDFFNVYKIRPNDIPASKLRIELGNYHASIVACYFNTIYTNDKTLDAKFASYYNAVIGSYTKLVKTSDAADGVKSFEDDTTVTKYIAQLAGIVNTTGFKERERRFGHRW